MLSQDLRVETERTQDQTVASMYYQSQGSYQFDTAETTYCTACPISADPRRWYRYNAFDSCAAQWHHSTVVLVQLVGPEKFRVHPESDSRLRNRLTRWCSKLRLRLRLGDEVRQEVRFPLASLFQVVEDQSLETADVEEGKRG